MSKQASDSELGKFIEAQRRAQALSGPVLAGRAGIDKGVLSRIERGETTKPSPRVLLAIARALEIDVFDLYRRAGFASGANLPSIEPYLRAKFDLPEEAVHQIAEIVEMYNERYGRKEADDGNDDRAA